MKKPKTFKPKILGTGKKFSNKPKRMYDTVSWVEFRIKFLSANPKCYACSEKARVTDHIIAAKLDEKKFWCETNYIPLCLTCHNTITGFFDRHNPPLTEEKLIWINKRRMDTGTAIKVKVVSLPAEKK